MRYMRPNLCSLLLAFLLVFACDLRAQGDSLRLIWSEQSLDLELETLGTLEGLSNDGWLLATRSGYQVELRETHSLSVLGTFSFEQSPLKAHVNANDMTLLVLLQAERGEWRDSDPFGGGDHYQVTPDRLSLVRIDLRSGTQTMVDSQLMVMGLVGIDESGDFIIAQPRAGLLHVWDTQSGTKLASSGTSLNQPHIHRATSYRARRPYLRINGLYTRAESKYVIVAQPDTITVYSRDNFRALFHLSDILSRSTEVFAAFLTKDDNFKVISRDSIITIDLSRGASSARFLNLDSSQPLFRAEFWNEDSIVIQFGNQRLASAGEISLVRLSDLLSTPVLKPEQYEVMLEAFPATARLAISDLFRVSYMLDVHTGSRISVNPFPQRIEQMILDRASSTLLIKGAGVTAVDPETREFKFVNHDRSKNPIAISPHHIFAAAGAESGNDTRIVEPPNQLSCGHY